MLFALMALLLFSGPLSVNSSCTNGQCFVAVASSWKALPSGLLLTLLSLFWPRPITKKRSDKSVGILRRFGAFFIDLMVVTAALGPLLAAALVFVEARETGSFAWSFSRNYTRPSDWLLIVPGILLIQASLVLYFFGHLLRERQTIGRYIFGFTFVPSDHRPPRHALSVWLSFVGLCLWPLFIYRVFKRTGRAFWWDEASNMKAVLVR